MQLVRQSALPDCGNAVRSHPHWSLRDWFYVMFLFTTTRNGVAAKRVEREIGVTYKTAWRMCHEIRKYMAALDSDAPLGGPGEIVRCDETFIGGKSNGGGRGRQDH